ncbi:DUF3560 domain-containing protein [Dactylosporangium sp. CA-139066]|uniref:DUF3560 domain-containing protein n=1 Tax=Dactylosporangium sp. CA-139066 TaxID=3239930 RepID=UPI003D8DF059
MSTITISHTHAEGTLIHGSHPGDGVWEIVHQLGWRSSQNIGIYVPGSRDRDVNRPLIARTRVALQAAGRTVTEEIDNTPRTAAERRGALDERAADRADRYDARADRHTAEADRRYHAEHAILDGIPTGQPRLAGHHSYARHTRDLERAENHRRAGSEAADRAEHAAGRAAGARAHAAHRNDPRAIMRRIDKLEADVRGFQRSLSGYVREHKNTGGDVIYQEEHPAATGEHAEDLRRWIDRDREEIAHLRGKLAAMAAAGTFTAWTPEDFKAGDWANVGGRWCQVARVNRKSVSVRRRYDWHTDQDKPTPVPYDAIHGRRRDGLQWDTPTGEPWPVEQARKVARWRDLHAAAEHAHQHNYGTDEYRSARWVGMAVRLVHGIDTDAPNRELAAILDSIPASEHRDLTVRYLEVYERLSAGALPHEIADSIEIEPGKPAWTFPTDRETATARAGRAWPMRDGMPFVEPGDLIVGQHDGGGFAGGKPRLHQGFCGPVAAVSDVLDRREAGTFVTITLTDGTAHQFRTGTWFEVHRAGAWETGQAPTPQTPAAEQTFTEDDRGNWHPVAVPPAVVAAVAAEQLAEAAADPDAARRDSDRRARRIEMFAAKLAADTFRAEPPRTIDPTDETIAAMLAGCAKPPTPDLHNGIRMVYRRLLANYQREQDTAGETKAEDRRAAAADAHAEHAAVIEHDAADPDAARRVHDTRSEAPAVRIERHRASVTQGEVSVWHHGELLGRFGDNITLCTSGSNGHDPHPHTDGAVCFGGFHGRNDAYWSDVADRHAAKRAAPPPRPAAERSVRHPPLPTTPPAQPSTGTGTDPVNAQPQPAGRYEIEYQLTPRPHAVQDPTGRVRVLAHGRHGWAHLANTEWDDDQPTHPQHPAPTPVVSYLAGRADPDPHTFRDARGRVRVWDQAHTQYDRYGWADLVDAAWDDPQPATTTAADQADQHTLTTDTAGNDVCALDGVPFPCAEA